MPEKYFICIVWLLLMANNAFGARDSLQTALEKVRAVGQEGEGNETASSAWKIIAAEDAKSVLKILEAMDGANDLAMNWLRGAVDAIAERTPSKKLPLAKLESFLKNTKHHARARRLAYELIERADVDRAHVLIDGMLDDPGSELRREAVERITGKAAGLRSEGQKEQAIAAYQTALRAARDVDQIDKIAKTLRELGQTVELPKIFGWVSDWKVIGPFDSTKGAGFDAVYAPEQNLDFQKAFPGKSGEIRWQDVKANGDYGMVDLNKPCGTLKEVAGYAVAELNSTQARPVEIRLGTENAWKLWLNGKYLFGRDEYHRGNEIDQYRLPCELKPGRNVILIKLCQNEQVEDWTKGWEFQMRLTDPLGAPIEPSK